MKTELGFHRLRDLALGQLECGIRELGDHLTLGEISKNATRRFRRGVGTNFAGELFEIGAALELGEHVLRFLFGLHKNVACANLFFRLRFGDRLVVELLHFSVGRRLLREIAEQRFHQHLVLRVSHALFEIGRRIELLLGGSLRERGKIDHVGEQRLLAGIRLLHLEAGANIRFGDVEIALTNFHAVYAGEHRVVFLLRACKLRRADRQRDTQKERERERKC